MGAMEALMAGDKKTLKFQMMMSEREAATLDDWMFSNRMRSRAEAIRRLCQIGMIYDAAADALEDRVVDLYDRMNTRVSEVADVLEAQGHESDAFMDSAVDALTKSLDDAEAFSYEFRVVSHPARGFREAASVDRALLVAPTLRDNAAVQLEEVRQRQAGEDAADTQSDGEDK